MDEVVKCRLQGWRVTKPLAGKRLVQKKWLEASSEASHFTTSIMTHTHISVQGLDVTLIGISHEAWINSKT
jgi:hypothetical protein